MSKEEKQIRIPTVKDMQLINDYADEQDFWKKDTKEEVLDLFVVLVGYGLEPQKAINNINGMITAMKNEYRKGK